MWWCGSGLIVTIGLNQRTYSTSGWVRTGISDAFHRLYSWPHHLVI